MTLKGREIGDPTLKQVEDYIKNHNLVCDPKETFDYYSKRGFLTVKGNPIKSLEAMCASYNGVVLERERKRNRDENCIQEVIFKSPTQISDNPSYAEQLNDKRWHAFRQFVLTVRGAKCEFCGAKKNLNIHHLLYHQGCKAWEYNVLEVRVLCHQCHKKVHNIQ